MLLPAIQRGGKHTTHIASALPRLEATARQASNRRKVPSLREAPDDQRFQEDLRIFQGWLASLFEVCVTIFSFVEGSRGATEKAQAFADAAKSLLRIRAVEQNGVSSHPELFKALTEM